MTPRDSLYSLPTLDPLLEARSEMDYSGETSCPFLRAAPGGIVEGEASFSGLGDPMGCLPREAPSGQGMEVTASLGSKIPASSPKQMQLLHTPEAGRGSPPWRWTSFRGCVCCGRTCTCTDWWAPGSSVGAEGSALEAVLIFAGSSDVCV